MSCSEDFLVVQKSWFFRNVEEEKVIPARKVIDAAADAFEKAKASASYGIMDDFKYVVYLPLKAIFFKLDLNQTQDLNLYNEHSALCSEIEKVRSIFWQYYYAKENVIEAMDETERTDCRNSAFSAGNELVEMYDNLITLAIEQAASRGFDKAQYLNDLHNELNRPALLGGDDIPLYKTVNMILATKVIENSFLTRGKDALNPNYLDFVTDFISNIREASFFSGNMSLLELISGNASVSEQSAAEITNAFILGLSTIPEFGDGLTLITLYNALTKQQKSIAVGQNDGLQYFQEQLEYLMKRDQDIENVDLQSIQYKGISLLSVMTLNVDQLNQLKKLKENLQNLQFEIQQKEAGIVEDRQFIAQPVDYSFNDVQVFLNDLVNQDLFNAIPKDDTALGRLATSYTEAFEAHAALTKQITDLTEIQTQAKAGRAQAITTNQEEVTGSEEEIKRLNLAMGENSPLLRDKHKELRVLQEGIAKKEKELAGEKEGSDQIQNDLNKLIMDGFKSNSAALVQPLEEEVDKLRTIHDATSEALKTQRERLDELKKVQAELIDADGLQNKAEALLLQGLNEQLKGVKERKIAELSGEDVKALAGHLGIEGNGASENSLAQQLNTVLHVEARVKRLTDSLPQSINEAQDIKTQVDALEDAMFSEAGKSAIATQLQANLVIAKKVTYRVGWEIVARQKKDFSGIVQKAGRKKQASNQDEYKQVSLNEKQACNNMVSMLEVHLDKIKEMDGDASNLGRLVNQKLKKFEPDVKANQPNATNSEVFKLDAEEDGDPEKGII